MTTDVDRVAASPLTRLDNAGARSFRHIPALDGVRALAIAMVLSLHFSAHWRRGGYGLFSGGYIGVDVFFVLSGFLITSLLITEHANHGFVSFRAFYVRRALRILPALAVVLLAHAVFVKVTTGDMASEVKSIIAVALFVANFVEAAGFSPLIQSSLVFTWSLAIEEHFYFVWPALLLFVVLRHAPTRRVLLAVLAAAVVASVAARAFTWLHHGNYMAAYVRTDCRVDGLLIGAIAAFAWRWRLVPRRGLNTAAWISLAGLVVVALFARKPDDVMFTLGFTLVALAAATVILAIAEDVWTLTPLFASPPMRAIGRVSYGLYLWHGTSLHISYQMVRLRYRYGVTGRVGLALVITVGAVLASWFLVERPALRLKERFAR